MIFTFILMLNKVKNFEFHYKHNLIDIKITDSYFKYQNEILHWSKFLILREMAKALGLCFFRYSWSLPTLTDVKSEK